MATVTKIQDFSEQLSRGTHQIGTHTFKVALTDTAPDATNTVLADITQIDYTNISDGAAPSVTIGISESSGTTTVTGDQVVVTATGTVPQFRYYVLYNDTATNKNLVAFWDHGSEVNLASGDTFTIKFNDQTSGGTIFTLA